jgi:hypothetical protein
VLTNGVNWRIYKVHFGQPIEKILVCELDAIEASAKSPEALECFGNLSREGFSKSTMAEFLLHKQVTNKFTVAAVLQTDFILEVLRREIRRMSSGVKVEVEYLRSLLQEEVIKRDLIEGDEAKARFRTSDVCSERPLARRPRQNQRMTLPLSLQLKTPRPLCLEQLPPLSDGPTRSIERLHGSPGLVRVNAQNVRRGRSRCGNAGHHIEATLPNFTTGTTGGEASAKKINTQFASTDAMRASRSVLAVHQVDVMTQLSRLLKTNRSPVNRLTA